MGIVTKKGDKGTTKLLSGEVVSKADPRLDPIGTLDELVSTLGLAKNLATKKEITSEIKKLQADLMLLDFSAQLHMGRVAEETDKEIERLESEIKLPKSFILPGATPCSSALDMARAIARRMEREVVALKGEDVYKNEKLFIYLNRLSDYLFLLARYAEKLEGVAHA